jgi:membrane protein DedA with SNARE-associated domain
MSAFEDLLQNYGLIAIVVGTFLEGETILVLAGLAAHRGYLSLPAVIAAGFLGTFLGDQLYFALGRRRGQAFLAKRPTWQPRIERARNFLTRHAVVFIFGFRFLYGLRTVSPFVIGMSHVPARRYLVLNTLGGTVWSVAVALLGYGLGEGAELLLGRVRRFEVWIFLAVAVAGATVWSIYLLRLRRASRREPPGGQEQCG